MKGDVHDIGKNIVAVVLGCNNFRLLACSAFLNVNRTDVQEALVRQNVVICLIASFSITVRTLLQALVSTLITKQKHYVLILITMILLWIIKDLKWLRIHLP